MKTSRIMRIAKNYFGDIETDQDINGFSAQMLGMFTEELEEITGVEYRRFDNCNTIEDYQEIIIRYQE